MTQILSFIIFAGGLMLAMLGMSEIGRRLGIQDKARDPQGISVGYGAVEAAVFTLMGLLVAFTFSAAAARFDARRQLIIEEANCIGTAYLRIDLLPPKAQPPLRGLFRGYLNSRINTFRAVPDMAAVNTQLAQSTALREQIWTQATAALSESPNPLGPVQMVTALNQMFDIATTRNMSAQMHTPVLVFVMLALVSVVSSFFAGYDMAVSKMRHRMHMLCFVGIFAISIYFILDFEYPRLGLVRLESFDKVLAEMQQGMGGSTD